MTIPSGVIVGWPLSAASIPSGWTRVSALDGRYPKGAPASTDPGTTGGASTHTHTTSSHTHSLGHTHSTKTSATHTPASQRIGGSFPTAEIHTHSFTLASSLNTSGSASPTSDSVTNELTRFEVIWIQSDGSPTQIPEDAIVLFGQTPPTGWDLHTDGLNRFLKGVPTGFDGGGTFTGNENHSHTMPSHSHSANHSHPSTVSGPASSFTMMDNTPAEYNRPTSGHTHNVTGGTTSATSGTNSTGLPSTTHEPLWHKCGVVASPGGLVTGIIALWLGTLANIPNGWILCDGSNGTPDLRDKYIKGANNSGEIGTTGGTSTHTHPAASQHNHSIPAHTHSASFGSQNTTAGRNNATGDRDGAEQHSSVHNTTSLSAFGSTSSVSIVSAAGSIEPLNIQVAFIQYQGAEEVSPEFAVTAAFVATLDIQLAPPTPPPPIQPIPPPFIPVQDAGSDIDIYIRNPSRITEGLLSSWSILTLVVRRNNLSKWTLSFPYAEDAKLIQPGYGVIIRRSGKTIMSGWRWPDLSLTAAGSKLEWLISGWDDTVMMADTLLWPLPTQPIGSQTDRDHVISGAAADRVRSYFLANVVNRLAVPGANAGSATGLGPSGKSRVRFNQLLEHAREICGTSVNFRVIQDDDTRDLVLQTWTPADKRLIVQFSPEVGTVLGWSSSDAGPERTRVIIGCGDIDEGRIFRERTASLVGSRESDWQSVRKIEQFLDARDLKPGEPDLATEADQRGDDYLIEGRRRQSLNLEATDMPGQRYGVEYDIGDLVRAYPIPDLNIDDLVEQVEVTWSNDGGERVKVWVGPVEDPEERDVRRERDMRIRLRRLEAQQ